MIVSLTFTAFVRGYRLSGGKAYLNRNSIPKVVVASRNAFSRLFPSLNICTFVFLSDS